MTEKQDELTERQVKNLKKRLVGWVWEAAPRSIIGFALFCGLKVPQNLVKKFLVEKQD